MKSLLTYLTITFFTLSAYGQDELMPELKAPRSEYFILDSFYHWGWDTVAFEWTLRDRTLYTTDANQQVTSEITSILNSPPEWKDSSLTTYTYDADSNLINTLLQLWDGTTWVNSTQDVYTYDGDNNQIGLLLQNWDGTAWANFLNLVFTYDNNHNQLTRTNQHWTGSEWADGTRQVSTYNGDNQLIVRLYQNYISGWNDVSRSLYAYDANQDLDTLLYQKWTLGSWNDDYRNLYDFDAHHNRILILEQLAVGINFWVDQDKYEYMYDQYDHITHLIYSHYDNNAWSNVYQYNIINDGNQNRATEVFQNWNNGWVNADSTQYYYTGITATHNFLNHLEMTMVPNPTSDYLFVEYPKPIDGTIGIYSIQGVKLLELKSNHEQSFRINVASLMPGVYFVALHVGGQVLTKGFEKL